MFQLTTSDWHPSGALTSIAKQIRAQVRLGSNSDLSGAFNENWSTGRYLCLDGHRIHRRVRWRMTGRSTSGGWQHMTMSTNTGNRLTAAFPGSGSGKLRYFRKPVPPHNQSIKQALSFANDLANSRVR